VVQQSVREGWIDEDVATLYPAATASMLLMRQQLLQLQQVVGQQQQILGQQQQQTLIQTVQQQLETTLDAAAQQGPLYEGLRVPTEREAFRTYLRELNPMVGQLTPQFVGQHWLAYKTQQLAAQMHANGTAPWQQWLAQASGGQVPAAAPPPPASSAPPRSSRQMYQRPTPEQGEQGEWAHLLPWNN
jgi:hypothetical protein